MTGLGGHPKEKRTVTSFVNRSCILRIFVLIFQCGEVAGDSQQKSPSLSTCGDCTDAETDAANIGHEHSRAAYGSHFLEAVLLLHTASDQSADQKDDTGARYTPHVKATGVISCTNEVLIVHKRYQHSLKENRLRFHLLKASLYDETEWSKRTDESDSGACDLIMCTL